PKGRFPPPSLELLNSISLAVLSVNRKLTSVRVALRLVNPSQHSPFGLPTSSQSERRGVRILKLQFVTAAALTRSNPAPSVDDAADPRGIEPDCVFHMRPDSERHCFMRRFSS